MAEKERRNFHKEFRAGKAELGPQLLCQAYSFRIRVSNVSHGYNNGTFKKIMRNNARTERCPLVSSTHINMNLLQNHVCLVHPGCCLSLLSPLHCYREPDKSGDHLAASLSSEQCLVFGRRQGVITGRIMKKKSPE